MSHEGIHFVELDPEEFVRECKAIIDKLEERGIIARILGAMAVYIHTERDARAREIHSTRFGAGVPMFTDLDLMAYKKQAKKLKEVFEKELGFLPDRMVNLLFSDRRLIYYHPEGKFHVDVFFNKLEFCHDVNFGEEPGKGRLELSNYSIFLNIFESHLTTSTTSKNSSIFIIWLGIPIWLMEIAKSSNNS